MADNGFHSYCNKVNYKRKPECDTSENGGNYRIINIDEYIKFKEEKFGIKFITEDISGIKYLNLFRSDKNSRYTKPDQNIFE